MEVKAAVVVGKKNKQLARSKLKNVLCRPDPDLWPALTEKQSDELGCLISKYHVAVPVTDRPPWSVLKLMPKSERPKSKRTGSIPGLIFGITQVARLLKSQECNSIILDSGVNPRILVKHIVENAIDKKVPIVCMDGLKMVTSSSFGFPTCCLALKKSDSHEDLKLKIAEYWKIGKWEVCSNTERKKMPPDEIQVDENVIIGKDDKEPENTFKYLLRTSKNCRVFVPPSSGKIKNSKDFSGQNFIKFTKNPEEPTKYAYKGMILKRVKANHDRKKNKAKGQKYVVS